jgi:hypothetical protein
LIAERLGGALHCSGIIDRKPRETV